MSARGQSRALWVLAAFLMLGSAVYQRLTGPTNPLRTSVTLQDEAVRFRLPRSGTTDGEVRVAVPARGNTEAWMSWRRYPTDADFNRVAMEPDANGAESELVAHLPIQPGRPKRLPNAEMNNSKSSMSTLPFKSISALYCCSSSTPTASTSTPPEPNVTQAS